jgi:hypothetical protein
VVAKYVNTKNDVCFRKTDTCPDHADSHWYKSLPDIWSSYAQGYLNMPNAYIIRYEDLVVSPEETIASLASYLTESRVYRFNVTMRKRPLVAEVMDDVEARVQTEAIEDPLHKYSQSEISRICKIFDKQLLAHFGYDDCEKTNVGGLDVFAQRQRYLSDQRKTAGKKGKRGKG